jgi:hypothetical protein
MMFPIDAVRRYVVALGLGLAIAFTVALPARADTISVFADLPVAMNLQIDDGQGNKASADASGLSGLVVGVTLPFFVGLAYENYGSKFNIPKVINQSFRYDVNMYDIFLNLPLPIVNIAAGLGAGSGKLSDGPANVTFKDATLTQYFVSLGVNVLPLLDIHVGYHAFSGSNDVSGSGAGSVSSLKVNGDMWSLGAKLGF